MLILDEPTRGVDVGAKREIYEIIRALCARGVGVILISSELPEVLEMSDRILVMHQGHVTAEIDRSAATEELVMSYASEAPVSSISAAIAASREHPLIRAMRVNGLPLAILVALLVITAVIAPEFFQVRNILNVARQASIVGVIAIGVTFVILTGGIDLSVGSILALCAVATAGMINADVPVPLIIVAAVALGAAVGVVNGLGVALLKIQPFIMTLAMMVLIEA